MKNLSLLFISSLVILFSGCVSVKMPCSSNPDKIIPELKLQTIFEEIAKELKSKCHNGRCNGSSTTIITDFVDIKTLTPRRSGMLMSELMKSSINKIYGDNIIQAEFSQYFTLNNSGLVVLTRDVKKIQEQRLPFSEAIVGTYNYTNNKLYIFVRKINIYTGKITSMVTKEINFSCVNGLMVDSIW